MASPAAPEPQPPSPPPPPPPPQPQPQPQPAANHPLSALPADVELFGYLRRWIEGGADAVPAWIREADVYVCHPDDLMLPDTATTAADGGVAWYFLTQLGHIGPHDARIRRTARGGTWKTEHHEPIASELDDAYLGVKTSLSFGVKGELGGFDRSGHLMREYLLGDDAGHVPQGERALCVLYHTTRGDDLAVSKAVQKARQRMKMVEEKAAAKSRRQEAMAAAKAAKAKESLAARREALKASRAHNKPSLKAAVAAAIRAIPTTAPPAAGSTAVAAATRAVSPTAPPAAGSTAVAAAIRAVSPTATAPMAPAPPAAAPTSEAAPTDALPVKRAAAAAAAAAAAKELRRVLATTSSSTGNASSPPKSLLLLQVGVHDHKVYDSQVVQDGWPFEKVKAIDFTGWVLLDPQSKDHVTAGPCATA